MNDWFLVGWVKSYAFLMSADYGRRLSLGGKGTSSNKEVAYVCQNVERSPPSGVKVTGGNESGQRWQLTFAFPATELERNCREYFRDQVWWMRVQKVTGNC